MGHLGFRLGRVLLVRIWTWSRLPNVKPENKIYKEGGFIIIQNVVII